MHDDARGCQDNDGQDGNHDGEGRLDIGNPPYIYGYTMETAPRFP